MSNRKWLVIPGLLACLTLLVGCGGVQGSHSVSPASFFIPGLNVSQGSVPPSSPVSELAHP